MYFSLEGNIGASKSTVMQELKQNFHDKYDVEFFEENTDDWQNFYGNDMLERFYNTGDGFLTQLVIMLSFFHTLTSHLLKQGKHFMTERSIATMKYVFLPLMARQGFIGEKLERPILQRFVDTLLKWATPKLIIYIDTPVSICHDRIRQRGRAGEEYITMGYLSHIEFLYRKWFQFLKRVDSTKVFYLDGTKEPKELAQEIEWIMAPFLEPPEEGDLFQRLNNEAKVPCTGSKHSAGFDLSINEDVTINPHQSVSVSTGIVINKFPPNTYGRIVERSSAALQHNLAVLGGVIDPDFEGEIKTILLNHGNTPCHLEKGFRPAQLIFEQIKAPEQLMKTSDTVRGTQGFGSSGMF